MTLGLSFLFLVVIIAHWGYHWNFVCFRFLFSTQFFLLLSLKSTYINWTLSILEPFCYVLPLAYRRHILTVCLAMLLLFSCQVESSCFATLWNIAHQSSLSTGFPRQEYWSGLPVPSPEDPPNPGIEPGSPALQADSLPLSHQGSLSSAMNLSLFPWNRRWM